MPKQPTKQILSILTKESQNNSVGDFFCGGGGGGVTLPNRPAGNPGAVKLKLA